MGFRDFAANRSFSENGLWQWDEKQGLARHRGDLHLYIRFALPP
jgi:hypothetical protein